MTRYPTKTHYSRNFTRAELDCKCGCKAPRRIRRKLRRLALRLEKLRRALGKPLGVTSGYRCPEWNLAVGGASRSMHMSGKAADLKVPKGKQKAYVAAAEAVPAFRRGGIGVYPGGGVHVDYRGRFARWTSF